VRFFTHDQPRQAARAIALMGSGEVWVSKTVLLETEWVLRSVYEQAPAKICEQLRRLAGMDNVQLEEPLVAAQALDWFANGLDFADALHLASSSKAERFVTFDEKLARQAKKRTTIEVTAI
jgi:predicted nucleic-acid-binding protein